MLRFGEKFVRRVTLCSVPADLVFVMKTP